MIKYYVDLDGLKLFKQKLDAAISTNLSNLHSGQKNYATLYTQSGVVATGIVGPEPGVLLSNGTVVKKPSASYDETTHTLTLKLNSTEVIKPQIS